MRCSVSVSTADSASSRSKTVSFLRAVASACPALHLAAGGAQVVVIDMSRVYGGHAVMSQGGVSIVDTPVQEAAGQKDSPDLAYKDFIEWGEGANREWVRYYVDHSREQIYDWLIDLGVQFSGIDSAPGNTVDRFHQPAGRGSGLVTPGFRAGLGRPVSGPASC